MQGVPCDRPGATRLPQGSGLSVVAAKYMCTRPDGFQQRPLLCFVSDLASLSGWCLWLQCVTLGGRWLVELHAMIDYPLSRGRWLFASDCHSVKRSHGGIALGAPTFYCLERCGRGKHAGCDSHTCNVSVPYIYHTLTAVY
jgi:hypothetical protein